MSQATKSLVLYKRHLAELRSPQEPIAAQQHGVFGWNAIVRSGFMVARRPEISFRDRAPVLGSEESGSAARIADGAGPRRNDSRAADLASASRNIFASREHELGAKTSASTSSRSSASAITARRQSVYSHARNDRGSPGDIQDGRAAEEHGDTSKATTFAKIRCFLRAAFRRGWIKEALVDKVTTREGRVRPEGTVHR